MKKGIFNWNYFFILIPVHYFVVLFTVAPQPLTFDQAWRWFVVATIAYLITGIGFFVVKHFDNLISTSRAEIAAAALLGAIRGFAILDSALLMGLPVAKPYLIRPLNSAVVVPIWFLVTHLIFGTRREFQEEFHRMYVRTIGFQIASNKARNTASAEELASRIENALAPLRKQLQNTLGTKMTAQQLADDALIIRSFVEAEIRPLSHELWRSRQFKPPRLGFLRVIRFALLRNKLPLNLALIPSFLFSFAGLTSSYGIDRAIPKTIFITTTLIVISILYHYIYEWQRIPTAFLNSLTILCALILPGQMNSIVDVQILLGKEETAAEILGSVYLFLLLIGFTAYKGVSTYYDTIREIIKEQIDSIDAAQDDSFDKNLRREFASYLHGDVQSELLSTSMQLQKAADLGNFQLGKNALKRANEILRRDHQTYVVGNAIDPSKKLERLVQSWNGIAEIEIGMDPEIEISESAMSLLVGAVEELISNAVRHGAAKEIRVDVVIKDGDVKLTFRDDGLEIKRGHKGLGSEILKKQTLSYEYQREMNGNQIVITLPN